MRTFTGAALAVTAAILTALPLSAIPAAASVALAVSPCGPKTDFADSGDGTFAWCETGEGYIRAKATCTEEATFRKYTVTGPRVYSRKFGGNYMSAAWCRSGDAADKKSYIPG
jgi:hypothetical protein